MVNNWELHKEKLFKHPIIESFFFLFFPKEEAYSNCVFQIFFPAFPGNYFLGFHHPNFQLNKFLYVYLCFCFILNSYVFLIMILNQAFSVEPQK